MSYVTTVIVSADYWPDADFAYINASLKRGGAHAGDLVLASDHVTEAGLHVADVAFGGTKLPEARVALGAFNYLDVEDFFDALKARNFRFGLEVVAYCGGDVVYRYSQPPFDPAWPNEPDTAYVNLSAPEEGT